MTELETIEGHVVEQVDQMPAVRPGTLLEGSTPRSQLAHAQEIAKALADVVEQQKLYTMIRGRKHVRVEGWTMLGSILGVFPVTEWSRETADGWEARVVAKTLTGADVGAAEASCSRSEKSWADRDDYAIRSMAQTRATGKALRMPLGFVMTLAGYEATPEEEMPREGSEPLRAGSGREGPQRTRPQVGRSHYGNPRHGLRSVKPSTRTRARTSVTRSCCSPPPPGTSRSPRATTSCPQRRRKPY